MTRGTQGRKEQGPCNSSGAWRNDPGGPSCQLRDRRSTYRTAMGSCAWDEGRKLVRRCCFRCRLGSPARPLGKGREGKAGRRVAFAGVVVLLLFSLLLRFQVGGEGEERLFCCLPSASLAASSLSLLQLEEEDELQAEPRFCSLASESGMATRLNYCYKFIYY